MKYEVLILASLAPMLTSCAATQGMGTVQASRVMAIYSPPARLGGQGSMIFLPVPAPQAAPVLPAELTADYSPGPWSIFFEADTDRPSLETKVAVEQIASMTARFPAVGVYLCSVGTTGLSPSSIASRKRLETVQALLKRNGVARAAVGPDRLCGSVAARSEPFVWVTPAID